MKLFRKIIGLSVRGAIAGSLLAWAAPSTGLSVGVKATTNGCGCWTGSTGKAKCNAAGNGCDAGSATCVVTCS